MMNKIVYVLILFVLFPLDSVPYGDTQTNEQAPKPGLPALIKQCEGCHGPDGRSNRDDVPSLAGIAVEKVKEAMARFYYYERHCPTITPRSADSTQGDSTSMCNIASTLSDSEVRALAQYFNTR